MRIPLHIKPSDHSESANRRRLNLRMAMAQLNPIGFRIEGERRGVTKTTPDQNRWRSIIQRLAALAPKRIKLKGRSYG